MNSHTLDVLEEVALERERQDAKWGQQDHRDGTSGATLAVFTVWSRTAAHAKRECDSAAKHGQLTWAHVLFEEFAEVLEETDPAKLRTELLQLAAVSVAWAEAIDRRSVPR